MSLLLLAICCFLATSLRQVLSDTATEKYSSFRCIGGSQVLDTDTMQQASVKVFPLNNPEFRTCKYRNVCLVKGALTYFQQHAESSHVPAAYLPKGFDGNIHHLSYLRGFTMPIHTQYGAIPSNYKFHSTKVVFLDSNSWSFNYGHYLNDNVIPTFTAAKLFDVPFEGSQQLFETNCMRFSTLGDDFTNRIVAYNRSMGTYRQACLEKLNHLYQHFYDHAPLYADQMSDETLCFDTLIGGQGSTFGLKSVDLSRAYFFRSFRDFVLQRNGIAAKQAQHSQSSLTHSQSQSQLTSVSAKKEDNIILVGLRTVGSAGGSIINDLCEQVTRAFSAIDNPLITSAHYRVKCFVPSDLSFVDEILEVQQARILVSVHGTITYMSLFSRDGTVQISLAHPKELKENQMLLYATHFTTLYLTWDKIAQLSGLLEHAIALAEANKQP